MEVCPTFVPTRQSEQDASVLPSVPVPYPRGRPWRHSGRRITSRHIVHNQARGPPLSRDSRRPADHVFVQGGKKRTALGPPDPASPCKLGPFPHVACRVVETPSTGLTTSPDPPTSLPTLDCDTSAMAHSRHATVAKRRSQPPRTCVQCPPTPQIPSHI